MNIKNRIFYSVIFKIVPGNWKFKLIYKFNLWASDESISGPGSEVYKTRAVVDFLTGFIKNRKIKTILDIPCGDFNWMQTVNLSGIQYLGGDVVEQLVRQNTKQFGTENISFEIMDIITGKLPDSDLMIVRDLFIHFSQENTQKAMKNIKNSKIKYLLVTTFPDSKQNKSIRDGYNYNINLQLHPFSFNEPIFLIQEQIINNNERKCLGLWKVADL